MKFLLRQVWSCLIEQVVFATFKKRSSQIRRALNASDALKCFPSQATLVTEASGVHDTSFRSKMKRDAYICKELCAHVVLSSGTTMCREIVERMTKKPSALEAQGCSTWVKVLSMDWFATTFNSVNSHMLASFAFFVRHVGCLAMCQMRSLESHPDHTMKYWYDGGGRGASGHSFVSCIVVLVVCCDFMGKNACRLTIDSASSRILRFVMPIFALPSVVVVHRWEIHLRKFDGLAFLNAELLIRFPCSDENKTLGFSKGFWPSDEWDLKVSFRSSWVKCALTSLSCMTIASGSPKAFWTHSCEVSIFCNSPSSRSESAMLSMGSSKCICDWK